MREMIKTQEERDVLIEKLPMFQDKFGREYYNKTFVYEYQINIYKYARAMKIDVDSLDESRIIITSKGVRLYFLEEIIADPFSATEYSLELQEKYKARCSVKSIEKEEVKNV